MEKDWWKGGWEGTRAVRGLEEREGGGLGGRYVQGLDKG